MVARQSSHQAHSMSIQAGAQQTYGIRLHGGDRQSRTRHGNQQWRPPSGHDLRQPRAPLMAASQTLALRPIGVPCSFTSLQKSINVLLLTVRTFARETAGGQFTVPTVWYNFSQATPPGVYSMDITRRSLIYRRWALNIGGGNWSPRR